MRALGTLERAFTLGDDPNADTQVPFFPSRRDRICIVNTVHLTGW